MKRFIVTSAIISAFVVLSSCEQHEWKDTKLLHVDKAEKSDDHGHGEHSKGLDHDHAEKKDDHGSGSEGH